MDWDSFVKDIKEYENEGKGVLITGPGFPDNENMKKVNPDYHINIKLSKKNIIDKRREIIQKKILFLKLLPENTSLQKQQRQAFQFLQKIQMLTIHSLLLMKIIDYQQ